MISGSLELGQPREIPYLLRYAWTRTPWLLLALIPGAGLAAFFHMRRDLWPVVTGLGLVLLLGNVFMGWVLPVALSGV